MTVSRRRLLLLAPVGAALAACALPGIRPRVNVRDHGAVGDGTADDSTAIITAVAALKSGDTLYFPPGSYRFARVRPDGRAAIVLAGISDVAVDFAARAELVMDNLDAGLGTSHGIVVHGRATGITLRNIRIRWRERPVRRSFGDGIRVVGFPGEGPPPDGWTGSGGPVTGVRILDCEVRSSPQAGVIMMGVSDIHVDGLVVRDTLADGLHFNACRRAKVSGHRAFDTGDDGLALVTYHSEAFGYNNVAQTFSFPELTEWSDADFDISDVRVVGGNANGVRIAGADGVRIASLTVSGKHSGAGVIADSAAPGADAGWFYVASRGVRLNRIRVQDCDMGLHLLARPAAATDPRFTDFDVAATRITIRDCRSWGVRAESLTAQRANGFRLDACTVTAAATTGGNGGVGLENIGGTHLRRLALSHTEAVTVVSAVAAADLDVGQTDVDIGAGGTAPDAGPCVSLQDCTGSVGPLRVRWPDAPDTWTPVRITATDGDCGAVTLTGFSVQPDTVADPVLQC